MIHVERATLEDLTAIWEIDELVIGEATCRNDIYAAIAERQCLVAKQGWTVLGYAIRQENFFGFPFIKRFFTHPDHRRHGVASALQAYAENTVESDRIFTSSEISNTLAHQLFVALGYEPCGEISALNESDEAERFFVKWLT